MNCSIIICTRNRREALAMTLASVSRLQIPPGTAVELLVIDNGSTDGTAEVVPAGVPNMAEVRSIIESHRGQCFARNRGLAEAKGEIILFTDDDIRHPANWLAEMIAPITNGRADATVGGVRLAPHLRRPWMREIHRAWLACTDDLNLQAAGVLIGASMAFSRRVLERVPAFDTDLGPGRFSAADDVLFSWQLKEAGFRIAGVPHVTVEHHLDERRLTREAFLERADHEGRQEAYLSWHWLHSSLNFCRLRMWKHSLQLACQRMLSPVGKAPVEGCAEWELRLVSEVAFHEQYLQERRRPRRYARRGLARIA